MVLFSCESIQYNKQQPVLLQNIYKRYYKHNKSCASYSYNDRTCTVTHNYLWAVATFSAYNVNIDWPKIFDMLEINKVIEQSKTLAHMLVTIKCSVANIIIMKMSVIASNVTVFSYCIIINYMDIIKSSAACTDDIMNLCTYMA